MQSEGAGDGQDSPSGTSVGAVVPVVRLPPSVRYFGPNDWSRSIAVLREGVAKAGFRVPPGSRLAEFEGLAKEFADGNLDLRTSEDPSAGTILAEAFRDFTEISTIVSNFPTRELALLGPKFKQVLGGALAPAGDRHPHARNIQYELYVAALLRQAGIRPRFQEPDLICTILNQEVVFAVKRLSSRKKFVERLEDGARQVSKSGRFGIVAISLDGLVADSPFRKARSPTEGVAAAPDLVSSLLNSYQRQCLAVARTHPVLGLLASAVVPCTIAATNNIGTISSILLRAFGNQGGLGVMMTLAERLQAGREASVGSPMVPGDG